MRPLTKKAFKDITRRKVRSALTVLGISIGVLGLTGVQLASDQLSVSFNYTNRLSARPDIELSTSAVPPDVMSSVIRVKNVQYIEVRKYAPARWETSSGSTPLDVVGIAASRAVRLAKFEITEGRVPRGNELLMESSNGAIGPVGPGSWVAVEARGSIRRLRVAGLTRTPGRPASAVGESGLAYMREQDLERVFGRHGPSELLIQVRRYVDRDATAKRLAAILRAHGVLVYEAVVGRTAPDQALIDALLSTIRVAALVVLLLSSLFLIGNVATMITEQSPIIGMMRAVGATQRQIMASYLRVAALYGVAGTAVGFVFGLVGADLLVRYVSSVLTLSIGPVRVNLALLMVSTAAGTIVPILLAALPVYVGTKRALCRLPSGYGPAPSNAGSIGSWARILTSRLAFVPQTIVLGVRDILRHRTSAVVSVIALAAAGAAYLSAQTATQSFNSVLDELFQTNRADISVSLTEDQPYGRVRRIARAVPGVARVEGYSQVRVETQWGTALLTGLEPGTQLYRRRLVAGRWLTSADHDVALISQDAASHSGLQVGGAVRFHTGLSAGGLGIVGVVRDYSAIDIGTGASGAILTTVRQVQAFRGVPQDYTQSLLIEASDHSSAAVDSLANRLYRALARAGIEASVTTSRQQNDRARGEAAVLYGLLYAAVIIVALVGFIALLTYLTIMVLERRREIGLLRAMGAEGRTVCGIFLAQALLLGLAGWILGMAAGFPASYGLLRLLDDRVAPAPYSFSPASLPVMLGFELFIVMLASIVPLWTVIRIRVAQALQYE